MSELQLSDEQIDGVIDIALAEDTSRGDITSGLLIPPELLGKASLVMKAAGVLAGIDVARRVFLKVDPSLEIEVLIRDGAQVQPGDIAANISGRVVTILKAERTALNLLQRLSGIATLTARLVAETEGCPAKITDTRKTTPGLRRLEKYAVRTGGGRNHRLDLGDGVLIKDNHLAALRALGVTLQNAVARAKQSIPQGLKVEVEVSAAREAAQAVAGGADIILLDNMSPDEMRQVVSSIPANVKTEASGGITMDNVRAVAMTGVDIISIGALTHSPRALDISLELEPQTLKSF